MAYAAKQLLEKLGDKTDEVGNPIEYTISKTERTAACGQRSSLGHHVPLAKIHKFAWLRAEEHGKGLPLDLQGALLKFRFINPLNNSASAALGKLMGKITKPIKNSGLRHASM